VAPAAGGEAGLKQLAHRLLQLLGCQAGQHLQI
jgi:hypothetical protein